MARSVLIIRQTPAVHDEIQKVIRRIEVGDPKGGPAQRPFVTSVLPVVGTADSGRPSVSSSVCEGRE
jgi:hypothetical protein